jgi:hypothetical protein
MRSQIARWQPIQCDGVNETLMVAEAVGIGGVDELPYQPDIPMQPRPTAETSRPCPSVRTSMSGVDKALSDRVEVREDLGERNRPVAIGELDLGVG